MHGKRFWRKTITTTSNYFRDLKDRAKEAATRQDAALALTVCKEIGAYEVFVAQSPNLTPAGEPIKLKVKYPSMCQKCGGPVPTGTEALWVRNKGCWHMECLG